MTSVQYASPCDAVKVNEGIGHLSYPGPRLPAMLRIAKGHDADREGEPEAERVELSQMVRKLE